MNVDTNLHICVMVEIICCHLILNLKHRNWIHSIKEQKYQSFQYFSSARLKSEYCKTICTWTNTKKGFKMCKMWTLGLNSSCYLPNTLTSTNSLSFFSKFPLLRRHTRQSHGRSAQRQYQSEPQTIC